MTKKIRFLEVANITMKIRKHTPEESEAYKKFIYNHFTHTPCPLCKGKGIVPKPDTKDDVKAVADDDFDFEVYYEDEDV